MGLFSNLGKVATGALHVLSPVTNIPAALKWAGGKSQGAQDVNSELQNRLGMGNGKAGYTAPVDPLDSFISSHSDLTNPVDRSQLGVVRGRANQDYNAARSNFSNFAQTGGWNDADKASIMQNVGKLKNIGTYGAKDEAEANRVRGNGVYDEFARTGGVSDIDKANIRTRGNSVGSSLFAGLRRNLDTGNAVHGQGSNPGYTAQTSKMARDAARAENEASLGTELGLTDTVNKGRQWGAQGVSDAEKSLISNMLSGNTTAGSQEMAMLESILSGKKFGSSGLSDLYSKPGADMQAENMYNQMDQSRTDAYLRALGMKNDKESNLLSLLAGRNPNTSNWDKYGHDILNAGTSLAAAL